MVGAMRWLVTRHHLIVEPSGAAAVALAIREGARLAGRRVALVVTGSNVAWARFLRLVEGEGPAR
jgi:threonine dehydratase